MANRSACHWPDALLLPVYDDQKIGGNDFQTKVQLLQIIIDVRYCGEANPKVYTGIRKSIFKDDFSFIPFIRFIQIPVYDDLIFAPAVLILYLRSIGEKKYKTKL